VGSAPLKQSFLRHALVYGLGNTLLYAASFVLLPLYTRCLDPSEYGALEILNRATEVLSLCLLFTAARQATTTFYRQSADDLGRRRVVGTVLGALLAAVLLGAVALALAAEPIAAALDIGSPYLLRLAGGAALAEGATFVLLGLPQARLQSALFVSVNVSQLLVRIGLAITFVWGLRLGVEGVLLASFITATLFALGLGVWAVVCCRPIMPRETARAFLRFCMPFLPGGLCLFVLTNGDRFVLRCWTGLDGVGAYALGYKLAVAVTTFTSSPLHMVWGVRMYDVAREPDCGPVFSAMTTRILAIQAAVGLAVCLFQDEIVALLGGGRYAEAAGVIAPVMLAYWLLAGCCLMDAGFYIRRRTGLKTWINLAAMVVVMVLYLLLIPRWGIYGAAYATIGGFAFQALLTRCVVQRVFPVAYEDGRLIALLGSAVVVWTLARLVPSAVWTAGVKGALWALWVALLWTWGVITAEEKRWTFLVARSAVRQVRSALAGLAP
jgi:O-antigen/teichoic acid export membrane protein